jgi:hypothetical protein
MPTAHMETVSFVSFAACHEGQEPVQSV